MSSTALVTEPLYSSLASDPDLAELVELFVAEMPARCDLLQQLFAASNWSELKRAAHQLKGAAGGYGFDQLTPWAAQLEKILADGRDPQTIEAALAELLSRCRMVRSGIQLEA